MQQTISIPYGKTELDLIVEKEDRVFQLVAKSPPKVKDLRGVLREALLHPIGSPTLREIGESHRGDSIAIIVNDITRPTPSRYMVEELVKDLGEAGICDEQIKIVVATGSHRPNTDRELEEMLGKDVMRRFSVENHDCEDKENLEQLGYTPRGLPLVLNKTLLKARIKILTGVISPHHCAGYSGGRKSVLPGVAGLQTIKKQHSFPIRPFEPALGILEGNPFHEEALFAAERAGVDFIVNVVLNDAKETVAAVAGHLDGAHQKGVAILNSFCQVSLPERADIVITSPGGYPRDINLYQAQKALSPGEMIVAKGGVIILVAESSQGIDTSAFSQWLKEAKTPMEVIQRFEDEGFVIGSNKAFMYARALSKARVIVVSHQLSQKELKSMLLEGATTLPQALSMARTSFNRAVSIAVMANACNLIPKVEETL